MPEPLKRILIVTTELGLGGAERCVANLACGLDQAKYAVQVVALAPSPEPPKDALIRQLQDAQIPFTFLGCRTKWQFLSATSQLKRIIRETQPDVVWSFLFHANIIAAMATRGENVVRLQSLRVIEQGGWRRSLQAWAAKGADRVLCVSAGVRRFAAETLGIAEAKLQVIPNGIDVDSIVPTTYAEPVDRKHRIIAVGRLDPQKDYETMLQAVSNVTVGQDKWELVIVGDGPERKKIAEAALRYDTTERMQMVGWQPDVSSWLRDAEIFLLTSRWEGMPNALIEAMAHGLAVVSTNVEGIPELLPGELAAQIASKKQLLSGQSILEKLIANPALRQQLGQANRNQIEAHFSLRQMLQSYETMLDYVLSNRPPQR
ncbi:glycosyltransferase [Bremerella alba]|uniref:Glycosyltransferase Gtf1 n=1 Tax=Bremerella alba TaxID=980252 RepID=A0A7V8V346_9BACT|nr:glycosyltransferase [Bremerella alba]MBA2114015.1 Glycosyltransferase Gtf1 [Bremerella alba]